MFLRRASVEIQCLALMIADAGIRVVMITGDNKDTAEAVADLVHIREGFDKTFPSYTGKEFEALSASEKMRVLSSRKSL